MFLLVLLISTLSGKSVAPYPLLVAAEDRTGSRAIITRVEVLEPACVAAKLN